MPEDKRNSQRVTSSTVTVQSGNSATNTVVSLNPEQTLAIGYLKVEYESSGGTESEVTLYDEDEGTGEVNLEDGVESFFLSAGDREVISDPFLSEIEEDLVVAADGNQDARIKVTVGGALITG